ncbi:hypothetical protein HYV10_00035 [Candidatus Dependentiae bacterium]|nr:hypothetical protein [Candidatus Dependentiae bacterium]
MKKYGYLLMSVAFLLVGFEVAAVTVTFKKGAGINAFMKRAQRRNTYSSHLLFGKTEQYQEINFGQPVTWIPSSSVTIGSSTEYSMIYSNVINLPAITQDTTYILMYKNDRLMLAEAA